MCQCLVIFDLQELQINCFWIVLDLLLLDGYFLVIFDLQELQINCFWIVLDLLLLDGYARCYAVIQVILFRHSVECV